MLAQTASPAVETFNNATIYLKSEFMGNIVRRDCKEVKVTRGVKYAQYNDAIRVEFLEKGKRKPRGTMLTYRPFLVILPTSQAIEPDSMCGPQDAAGCSQSRYSSCDEGWIRDFMSALAEKSIAPLLLISNPA